MAANLAVWIDEEQITFYHTSVSLFRQLFSLSKGKEGFPTVRAIRLGGDTCSMGDVDLYKMHFSPDCIFINILSGTESGNCRVYYLDKDASIEEQSVPVGYATAETEVRLLDENGNQVDYNQIGEISIRSEHLPSGYWRKPGLTAAQFLPDPDGGSRRIYLTGDLGLMRPDGCLLHLGRKDFRVKIRGYSVEPVEIEAALLRHPSIYQAVVIASSPSE